MNKRTMRKTKYPEIHLAEPTIRIGKKRATDSLVSEIAKQLDKREVVKVKVLKTALVDEDMEELAQKVAKETDSKVVYLRGHTFALYRPKEI